MDAEKTTNVSQNETIAPLAGPTLASADASPSSGTTSQMKSGGIQKTLILCTVIVVVALLISTVLGAWLLGKDNQKAGYTGIDSSRYQAVFLTNGQVYFGKMSDNGSELVKLTNIWYLQVQQGQQSADTLKDSESKITLSKLGNELHGPDDSMSISKEQVLFWENLQDDSKVVKTIKEAK